MDRQNAPSRCVLPTSDAHHQVPWRARSGFETKQKEQPERLVRFLAPPMSGTGFLSESAEVMYALAGVRQPGAKRVGTHQMTQSFMGSDLSTSDMNVIDIAPLYAPSSPERRATSRSQADPAPSKSRSSRASKMWVDAKTRRSPRSNTWTPPAGLRHRRVSELHVGRPRPLLTRQDGLHRPPPRQPDRLILIRARSANSSRRRVHAAR